MKDKAAGFDEKTCLVLHKPDQNESSISISIRSDENEHNANLTKLALKDALHQVYSTYCAASQDKPIPSQLPAEHLARLVNLGDKLPPKVDIAIKLPETESTTVTAAVRKSLQKQLSYSTRSNVEFVGQIFAVNVKAKTFEMINTENDVLVQVPYTDNQEDSVTHALREHDSIVVRVGAVGTFDKKGNVNKVHQMNTLELMPIGRPIHNKEFSFEECAEELMKNIPEDELARLPPDLSERHDDYITGRKTY